MWARYVEKIGCLLRRHFLAYGSKCNALTVNEHARGSAQNLEQWFRKDHLLAVRPAQICPVIRQHRNVTQRLLNLLQPSFIGGSGFHTASYGLFAQPNHDEFPSYGPTGQLYLRNAIYAM